MYTEPSAHVSSPQPLGASSSHSPRYEVPSGHTCLPCPCRSPCSRPPLYLLSQRGRSHDTSSRRTQTKAKPVAEGRQAGRDSLRGLCTVPYLLHRMTVRVISPTLLGTDLRRWRAGMSCEYPKHSPLHSSCPVSPGQLPARPDHTDHFERQRSITAARPTPCQSDVQSWTHVR